MLRSVNGHMFIHGLATLQFYGFIRFMPNISIMLNMSRLTSMVALVASLSSCHVCPVADARISMALRGCTPRRPMTNTRQHKDPLLQATERRGNILQAQLTTALIETLLHGAPGMVLYFLSLADQHKHSNGLDSTHLFVLLSNMIIWCSRHNI